MHFYNSIGPNPKVVRMFMHEKDMQIPTTEIDLMGGENRKPEYMQKNPAGQMPCLELDNGTFVTEIVAICEYLEDISATPSLIGSTAEEKAESRMWTRRIDLGVCEPLINGFRYSEGLRLFEKRMHVIPEAADGLKKLAQDRLNWLDEQIAGRQWICSDRFTLSDILLFSFLEFGQGVGQSVPDNCTNLTAWFERVKGRGSASA